MLLRSKRVALSKPKTYPVHIWEEWQTNIHINSPETVREPYHIWVINPHNNTRRKEINWARTQLHNIAQKNYSEMLSQASKFPKREPEPEEIVAIRLVRWVYSIKQNIINFAKLNSDTSNQSQISADDNKLRNNESQTIIGKVRRCNGKVRTGTNMSMFKSFMPSYWCMYPIFR